METNSKDVFLKFLKRKGALCLFYLVLEHRLFCPHADANRRYPRDLPASMQVYKYGEVYGPDIVVLFLCFFSNRYAILAVCFF